MYGQRRGKKFAEEIKLVRVKVYDDRTIAKLDGRKKAGRASCIAVLSLFITGAAVFSCPLGSRQQSQFVEAAQEKLLELPGQEQIQIPQEKIQGELWEEPEEIVMLANEKQTPKIAIDPGHGGEDEGGSGNGVLEKEVNLALALRLEEKLLEMGFEVMLIRRDDSQMTPQDRVQCAGEAKADIYVSIHQNSSGGKNTGSAEGIETWYCGSSQGSRRLAQLIQKGAVEETGGKDREIKETDELYVIRENKIPSCLIETGFLTNRAECAALVSPEYQEKLAEGIARGIDLYFNPKTMYLTFDDGPSQENTERVLDILKAHDIKATFFLVGENVKKRPEMARRIVEEGHTVGVHSYSHNYNEIYKSVDAYLEDFQKTYDIILETTGVEAQLFRFPGGSINSFNKEVYKDIIKAMTDKGYIYYDWNACVEDAVSYPTTPHQLAQNGVRSTRGRSQVVMLCHDVIYNTTQCLEELLDSLPEYKMEPLTPEVEPVQF